MFFLFFFFFLTAVPCVSENALMTFGSESDQQPTLSQTSTPGPGHSNRENRSTASPQQTIETMRNILDTIIPTQVRSFLVMRCSAAVNYLCRQEQTLVRRAAKIMTYLNTKATMCGILMC